MPKGPDDYINELTAHAEALYEALCREFDGFEDSELRLQSTEAMEAYRRFRKP